MMKRATLYLLPLALVVALLAAILPRGGKASAAGPSPIARGLPGGAVAYLEADDLGALLRLWRDSSLRDTWNGSAVNTQTMNTRLVMRLGLEIGRLEEAAGFSAGLDELILLAGKRGGVAVYDLAETEFVFEAEMASADLGKTPFAKQKSRFEQRKHAGIPYFFAQGEDVELAFAFVGKRLVASNSQTRLRQALLLAAAEEKVKTDGSKAGASLADDAGYTSLLAAAPADAQLRVYVKLSAMRGTHHFDDFWVFSGDSPKLDGIDAALIGLRVGDGRTVETRLFAYTDPAARPQAVTLAKYPGGGGVGQVDGAKATKLLPGVGLAESVSPAGARGAAERIARLLPRQDRDPRGSGAPPRQPPDVVTTLTSLLDAAGAGRMFESVSLTGDTRRGMPVEWRHGVIAIRLATPAKLDQPALEQAIAGYLRFVYGDGAPLSLAFADGTGGVRTVRPPIVDDFSITLARAGDHLIVGTDPRFAARVQSELGQAQGLATLLAPDAPAASRWDVSAAANRYRALAQIFAVRPAWDSDAGRELITVVIPALFDLLAGINSVTTVGYLHDRYYVEQVTYQ